MSLYSKPQIELLLDLINESNPGLMELRDLQNTSYGVPKVRTPGPGEIADTTLELYAKPGTFYIGKQIVHYRRVDLSRLFANMVVLLDRWQPGSIRREYIVEQVNKKYNLSLIPDDLPDSAWSANTHNVTIAATSLAYRGTLRFQYAPGKRDLDQILNKTVFDIRDWDAQYVEGKPLLSLAGVGIDYTRLRAPADSITNGWVIAGTGTGSAQINQLFSWFSKVTGITLAAGVSHTQVGGMAGLTVSRFNLPSANAPEGNAEKFNRVLVIASKPDSWFTGKLLIHYNW